MLHHLQVWLVNSIIAHSPVATLMRTAWAWPIAESVHFLGLCMLIGCIGAFDLRLLGVARRVPIASMHRLIPWGILGFVINISSGVMFVLTEPDQYIYNPSFQLKFLFIMIAGLNAGMFYVSSYRQVFGANPSLDAPLRAKLIAAISLGAWVSVIVCGRLITFYRPAPCSGQQTGLLLQCSPGKSAAG
jgi:cytochrome bd-type quinol oxidase subunit 1